MLGVIVEHFLSQFELSVTFLHDDLPQRGALYNHRQMEAQVVAEPGPRVPEVRLIDPVLKDDLGQALQRLVVTDDLSSRLCSVSRPRQQDSEAGQCVGLKLDLHTSVF